VAARCNIADGIVFSFSDLARILARSAFVLSLTHRRKQDEGQHDDNREQRVRQRKNPSGKVVVKYVAKPAGDEAAFRRAGAQLILPDGERTGDTGERFDANEEDRGHVQYAKEEIANDPPAAQGADPYERHAADNERHEQRVNQENDVGEPAHVAG
jgi:hypothetical protein